VSAGQRGKNLSEILLVWLVIANSFRGMMHSLLVVIWLNAIHPASKSNGTSTGDVSVDIERGDSESLMRKTGSLSFEDSDAID
jgi:hypothetical protein